MKLLLTLTILALSDHPCGAHMCPKDHSWCAEASQCCPDSGYVCGLSCCLQGETPCKDRSCCGEGYNCCPQGGCCPTGLQCVDTYCVDPTLGSKSPMVNSKPKWLPTTKTE
ncbi:hypothetical protein TrRE_jg9533 [Triparma retinervis]|uniref:Granulins domain-containing protein n=1 Tax=Triparma retinervis TaxID=2557542 RepID=A0A9W7AJ83_9STRA|nr:hypothetical protein TrRE_jg9533 [Triparma retinervis]